MLPIMSEMVRPHTGRARNEAARRAILDAALELVAQDERTVVSVDAIAARAGVGKQTMYRWWPSKYAVLLEAISEKARLEVPVPETGRLDEDLRQFLIRSFRSAREPGTGAVLRTIMSEAQHNAEAMRLLREFTEGRRAALRRILANGRDRGELRKDADLEMVVDQAYGVLWYRILVGHAPLSRPAAGRLADALIAQCS